MELLLSFILFAWVASVTPGPNNLMLLSSGMNYGFKATLPHFWGVNLGFWIMLVAVGLGLGEIFSRLPIVYKIMQFLGTAYLLYLAWNIAFASSVSGDRNKHAHTKPMSFMQAALFQWVNPKAWMMAVSAFSTYVPAHLGLLQILAYSSLFALINAPAILIWVFAGTYLEQYLQRTWYRRIFNWSMASLLVLSLIPFWLHS